MMLYDDVFEEPLLMETIISNLSPEDVVNMMLVSKSCFAGSSRNKDGVLAYMESSRRRLIDEFNTMYQAMITKSLLATYADNEKRFEFYDRMLKLLRVHRDKMVREMGGDVVEEILEEIEKVLYNIILRQGDFGDKDNMYIERAIRWVEELYGYEVKEWSPSHLPSGVKERYFYNKKGFKIYWTDPYYERKEV